MAKARHIFVALCAAANFALGVGIGVSLALAALTGQDVSLVPARAAPEHDYVSTAIIVAWAFSSIVVGWVTPRWIARDIIWKDVFE